jgi:hypothetical protein
MSLKLFNGADSSRIISAIQRDCEPEHIVSVQFRSEYHAVRSLDPREQWLRLQLIVGCEPVYNGLGISSLPVEIPAAFYYATGLETVGALANLLMYGGIHTEFVDDLDSALLLSRSFLDDAVLRRYGGAEAYSCHSPWCEWFIGDGILDETVLFGSGGDWWLLAVTGTD